MAAVIENLSLIGTTFLGPDGYVWKILSVLHHFKTLLSSQKRNVELSHVRKAATNIWKRKTGETKPAQL